MITLIRPDNVGVCERNFKVVWLCGGVWLFGTLNSWTESNRCSPPARWGSLDFKKGATPFFVLCPSPATWSYHHVTASASTAHVINTKTKEIAASYPINASFFKAGAPASLTQSPLIHLQKVFGHVKRVSWGSGKRHSGRRLWPSFRPLLRALKAPSMPPIHDQVEKQLLNHIYPLTCWKGFQGMVTGGIP